MLEASGETGDACVEEEEDEGGDEPEDDAEDEQAGEVDLERVVGQDEAGPCHVDGDEIDRRGHGGAPCWVEDVGEDGDGEDDVYHGGVQLGLLGPWLAGWLAGWL